MLQPGKMENVFFCYFSGNIGGGKLIFGTEVGNAGKNRLSEFVPRKSVHGREYAKKITLLAF